MMWQEPSGDKKIYLCEHCSEELKGKAMFCENCKTADKRKQMCKESKEVNPNYTCKICGKN